MSQDQTNKEFRKETERRLERLERHTHNVPMGTAYANIITEHKSSPPVDAGPVHVPHHKLLPLVAGMYVPNHPHPIALLERALGLGGPLREHGRGHEHWHLEFEGAAGVFDADDCELVPDVPEPRFKKGDYARVKPGDPIFTAIHGQPVLVRIVTKGESLYHYDITSPSGRCWGIWEHFLEPYAPLAGERVKVVLDDGRGTICEKYYARNVDRVFLGEDGIIRFPASIVKSIEPVLEGK